MENKAVSYNKMQVSVITTLFNYKNYISECITSVMSQDYKNIEMIIVDDFSDDNGFQVVSELQRVHNRVKLIRLNKNYGYSVAKNVGIKNSSGSVICMLDADDMLLPNSISSRMNKILDGYDFVHGYAFSFSKKRRWENELRKKWIKNQNSTLSWMNVHPQCVLLKKSVHDIVGLYDENLKCKSDREMWARIFNHGVKNLYIDKPVALYRHHQLQMHKSSWKKDNNKRLSSELMSLVEIRKTDISDCLLLSEYNAKIKMSEKKQKISNDEAAIVASVSPGDLYDDDFFSKRDGDKHDFSIILGEYATIKLGLRSVIDFGCGIGSFLSGVKKFGLNEIKGIEAGYESAKKYLVEDVSANICLGNVAVVSNFGKFDAAISIEVAEHLLPEQADSFCKNLANSSSRFIIITAAEPGQEGMYHFNCQKKSYWIKKIESLGFDYRKDLSDKISNGWEERRVKFNGPSIKNPKIPKYLIKNVMVFKINENHEDILKKNISIHSSNKDIEEKSIRISFDLPDNDSSGKHKFFQRLRDTIRNSKSVVVGTKEKSDIHFYINNVNNKSKVNIKRLDGVYFDGTVITKSRNAGIMKSMRSADGIIFQSVFCKEMGCKILNYKENKPSVIIKNGCDPLEFNVAPVVLDKPYFFALCKWRRHKRLKEAIEGFLHSNIENHYLVVSGKPDFMVKNPLIKYVGDLGRADMSAYTAGCIGTVHLAWIDWCPNSVVESLVAGKQVIHTDSGGTSEIVNGRGYMVRDSVWTGYQASPKNPPDLCIESISDAYRKSIESPIANFDFSDLLIENSCKNYLNFAKKILKVRVK